MPLYSYQCENADCGESFDKSLPMSLYQEAQICPVCDSTALRTITGVDFVLKGDGWSGKNIRIKNQMKRKNRRLSTKENEMKRECPNVSVSLAPNVDGERVDTWAEAKKLAHSKGKNTSLYDSYIRKERS